MITIPGKIPIIIHPLFWLIAFFIGWMWTFTFVGALVCVGVILFSVLFHEFGHALTAMLFGQKTRIELAAFGGFTYREGRKLKLWEEFFVVFNGPIAGFLLFLIAYTISANVKIETQSLAFALKFTYVANLFWTVLNLVPVLPLDGGHLLSIILEGIFGFKGVKLAILIGLGIAVAISVFFFIMGMFLVGALFLILTFESFRSLRYYKIFTEKDRDTELQQLMRAADQEYSQGNSEKALHMLEEVQKRTQEGILYTMAAQEMAAIYKDREEYEKAYKLLLPIQKGLSGDNLSLFHFLAYMNGDFDVVTRVGNKAFQDNPTFETALLNAFAYGEKGRAEPAVGWLQCAIREGLPTPRKTLEREEFDLVRQDPLFRSLVAHLPTS
ncbi:MAG: Stage IV sporulation protein FB [Chlamydiae bacterium]|nr:Stage IV sporulation protein FB [Chlamydiota bacterium]